MKHLVLRLIAASFLLTVMTGCGSGEKAAPTVQVKGKVLFNGSPLEKGVITFEPTSGNGSPASTVIFSGTYSINLELGPKRVRFSSAKVLGKKKVYEGSADSPIEEITEELIPSAYNAASNESYDVKAAASDVNFELKSK